MACATREIQAPVHDVFAIVSDPRTYPRWLAGAVDTRAVDDDWPRPGSKFHHRVGVGPLTIPDSSVLLAIETDRRLQLEVRARPLIKAIVTFTFVGDDQRCVISFEEEPVNRVIGSLVRPMLDPLTHLRNHRSLVRLGDLIESKQLHSRLA